MTTLKLDQPTYKWEVYLHTHFEVTIVGWALSDGYFGWNIGVGISEDHPLFQDLGTAMSLPIRGGVHRDAYLTYTFNTLPPGKKRETHVLKLDGHYQDPNDDWARKYDPKDGIPIRIQKDAAELVRQLLEYMS